MDRILIVEDERITAEDLHDILTDAGYEVTAIVSSGEEAIREAEHNPPDLALMDIRIKGEADGTEIARILQDRFNIPSVYLTAHADRETLQRAKRAKPLGYIVKPFQESEIQASIEIALHRHRHDRQVRERHEQVTDLLSALILGVISVDESEMVLLMNSAASELTGWAKDEAAGVPVRRIFRLTQVESGKALDLPMAEVLGNGRLAELHDALLVAKDGAQRPISGTISPMRSSTGGTIGAAIVFESADAKQDDPYLGAKLVKSERGTELQLGRFHVVAASTEMEQILALALRIARSEASTVLIEGEGGTGKDLLAHFLHYSSSRRAGPFVPVDCSAIPEADMESELFGHERGAFPGAGEAKKGLLEIANGGTLFLDEVGDLSAAMQGKLLRVLEEQSFRRLGSTENIGIDIRVVAATKRLADFVKAGDFRLDLFHRLSVIQIAIPPLRERPADILPLALHFIREQKTKYRSRVEGLSEGAATLLLSHSWPGNARELRNVMERAILVEDGTQLQESSIHFVEVVIPQTAAKQAPSLWSLKETERTLVVRALEKTGGNQTRAAKLLGITRDMLRYRMKKFKFSREASLKFEE
ncbi:MAG: sigma 54-interacting transcriptional regulator [Acidobacteriota bacterium]